MEIALTGATLRNEFAEVNVELDRALSRPRLKITDLSSGITAYLDPIAAFLKKGMIVDAESAEVRVEMDDVANGPRLKITDLGEGRSLYFDPLQLSDTAITGEWEQFPYIYDI